MGSDKAMNIGIIALGGLLVGGFLFFAMRPKTPAPPAAPKTAQEAKVIPTEAAPLSPSNQIGQIGLSAPPSGAVSADIGANQIINPNAQIAATGAPMAATTYYVASRQVNLRAGPNPNAQIIARLPFRTGMVATKQQTFIDPSTSIARVWVYVTVGTQSGWVNSTLISQTPFANPIDGQSATPQNTRTVWDANCAWVSTNKLNIRSSANPTSSVVIRVPYGTSLDCSGNLNAYVYPNTGERTEWMHVRYNGHIGWANTSYLSTY